MRPSAVSCLPILTIVTATLSAPALQPAWAEEQGVEESVFEETYLFLGMEVVAGSLYVGQQTDDRWQTVAFSPLQIEWVDAYLIGVGVSFELSDPIPTRIGTVQFQFEPQITAQWGLQDPFYQLDLPIGVRLTGRKPVLGINTFAFTIGPSYSSEISELEQERGDGGTENTLIYWSLQIEHVLRNRPDASLFARLHHRSDSFGLMGDSGSSNAVVLGLRRSF
jgi:hypothetical protein